MAAGQGRAGWGDKVGWGVRVESCGEVPQRVMRRHCCRLVRPPAGASCLLTTLLPCCLPAVCLQGNPGWTQERKMVFAKRLIKRMAAA